MNAEPIKYACPYCTKPLPVWAERETWEHCGEIGHAEPIETETEGD